MEFFQTNKTMFSIIKGILFSFMFTIIALTIFSALLVYTDLSEETIKPVIITVTGISILIGSSIGTKKLKKHGILNGAIIGASYIIIIYVLSSILNENFAINIMSIIMITIGIIGGILGRNNRSKHLTFKKNFFLIIWENCVIVYEIVLKENLMKRIKLDDRVLPIYTKGEEIFNMTSHIVGAVLGIVALVLCVIFASVHHNPYGVVSSAIFGLTMIVLYTMSSIYHGLNPNLKAKKVFQILDHCAIFLLIAGSYTPFALCTLREVNTSIRMGNFWNNLGNSCFRNYSKLNRFKKI